MRKIMTRALLLIALMVFASGCASYGKLRYVSGYGEGVTLQSLKEHWQDYDVYYAGLGLGHPSAILFDIKGDDRHLVFNRWIKVDDRETVLGLIDAIERQLPIGYYYPRLFEILGNDNSLYGYVFTAWDRAVMKTIDERTMLVYDLPLPPYLAINGRDGPKGQREPR